MNSCGMLPRPKPNRTPAIRTNSTVLPSWIMKNSDVRSLRSARTSCSATDGLPFLTSPLPMRSAAGWKRRLRLSLKPLEGGSVFALGPQMLHAHRDDASGGVIADGLAFGIHAELLELKDLLELHVAVLHAGYLGHADDAADAAAKARLLNDQVDGGADGLADGP